MTQQQQTFAQTLAGKYAIVTGGNSGIGLAIVKRLAEAGAFVFIVGRRQETLDAAVAEVGGESKAAALRADVAVPADLDTAYAEIARRGVKLDIIVANAGISEAVPTVDATVEHFDRVFNTNARGAYFTVQKALPLTNDGASIVVVGSAIWLMGMAGFSVYAATKAAVRSFIRTWTAELKDRKIRVNLVSPGPVETPIFDTLGLSNEQADQMREGIVTKVPAARMGESKEIASAVYFFASSEGSFAYGADLIVDGGITAL